MIERSNIGSIGSAPEFDQSLIITNSNIYKYGEIYNFNIKHHIMASANMAVGLFITEVAILTIELHPHERIFNTNI